VLLRVFFTGLVVGSAHALGLVGFSFYRYFLSLLLVLTFYDGPLLDVEIFLPLQLCCLDDYRFPP